MLNSAYSLWKNSSPRVADVSGILWTLSLQPLPPTVIAKAKAQGGNSLGLDPSEGALVLCLLSASWSEASDDDIVEGAGKKLFDDIKQAAVSRGLFNKFEYLNYAASFQDPIAGFGPEIKKRLQAVSQKYDPTGFFQTTVPGGFKLFEENKEESIQ